MGQALSRPPIIRTFKRADRLLKGGVAVSSLPVVREDLAALGVPSADIEAVHGADAQDQVAILMPHIQRHEAEIKQESLTVRRHRLSALASDLALQARRTSQGVAVPLDALAALVAVTGFDSVRVVDRSGYHLPRPLLRRSLQALEGCTVPAVFEERGLRLAYRASHGDGCIFLLGKPDQRGEALDLDLRSVGAPIRPAAPSSPAPGPRRHPVLEGVLDALLNLLAA